MQRDELDELRLAGGLDLVDDVLQRNADPRNDHRPRLDAAHAIDALFEGERLDEVFELVLGRLGDLTLDLQRPRRGLEVSGVDRRLVLAGAELVEIVVAGDVLVQVDLLACVLNGLFLIGPFSLVRVCASPTAATRSPPPPARPRRPE